MRDIYGYDEVVELAAQAVLSKFRYHGSVAVSVATLIALSIHPTPWCIDCEFPNPWSHISDGGDVVLTVWLLIAPFLAGLFALRRGWLVPVGMVLALLITQPLGGVAWWSLRENEGPFILILGLPTCAACFAFGQLVRSAVVLIQGFIKPHAD